MEIAIEVGHLAGAASATARAAVVQRGLDAAGASGGGRVVVPPGQWEIGPLELRSHTHLHLSPGCTLLASTDLAIYPRHTFGHNKDRQPFHFLYAHGLEGVGLTGAGVIDGQGLAHWHEPLAPSPWYREKHERPSPLLEFSECRGVLVQGITIRQSPGWTLHTFRCDDVRLQGVTVENHLFGPNTDGFDINGCRYVHVSDCRLHCGDDAIIIKGTEDAGRPCEYVTITNCVLESHCAAIGLGAETRSGIRYVTVSNCTVLNAIRMLQIIMWDGGLVENVTFTNITGRAMTPLGSDRAIHFDIQEHVGANPELGKMRNILCQNIVCTTRGRILLTAQDGAKLEHIVLRDVVLQYPEVEDPTVAIPRSRSSQLSNFSPQARVARAAVVADNVDGLVLDNVVAQWPQRGVLQPPMHGLWLRQCTGRAQVPGLVANQARVANVCEVGENAVQMSG